jgi:hypothetical protein
MTDQRTHLTELLAYYGSDVSQWPEEASQAGLDAPHNPRLAALVAEEKRFEQLLHLRTMAAVPEDLTQRIIAASYRRPQAYARGWFSEVLAEVRPAALAGMLALGFVIGFDMVTPAQHGRDPSVVQSSADDEGAIL